MIELKGFPFRNQLREVKPSDGKADENASYNCVPTSLAACIQYLTGKVIPADDLKDAVYGQGHIGGGDELRYGPYVAAHYGVKLGYTPLPSASQAIIDHIRAELKAGHPVIVTMHSAWSTPWWQAQGGGLHVGVAYAISETDAGVLHIMNPWRGFDHVQPVSWWRDRLGIGVWPVSKIAAVTQPAQPRDPKLPAGWRDDGTTLTCANGQPVVKGFREYVLGKLAAGQWQGGDAYLPEWGDASGTRQIFAATLLVWTPERGVYEGSEADALALAAHLRQGKAA